MKKPFEKLSPDEHELRHGHEHVGAILKRMGISAPTNTTELEAFNNRMEELFGLSEIRDTFIPIRYLQVCQNLGIESISKIGFKALLPEMVATPPVK